MGALPFSREHTLLWASREGAVPGVFQLLRKLLKFNLRKDHSCHLENRNPPPLAGAQRQTGRTLELLSVSLGDLSGKPMPLMVVTTVPTRLWKGVGAGGLLSQGVLHSISSLRPLAKPPRVHLGRGQAEEVVLRWDT